MENASKALIIAGAILLSILLISLGIMIFNQASNTISNSGMSDAELTAFNAKFTKYEGTISGNQAKSLLSEVMAHNSQVKDSTLKVNVNDKVPSSTSTITWSGAPAAVTIDNVAKYTVVLEYTDGKVSNIELNKK